MATTQPRRRQQSAIAPLPPLTRQRESPVSEVARQLLNHLLPGKIATGTRLPSERQLAEELGVGRSTVREALKALDVLGVIEVRRGDGTYLTGNSSDLLPQAIEWGLMLRQPKVLDLVEARSHIEVITAQLAAPRADAKSIAALEKHLAKMRSAKSNASFVDADIAFHLTIADTAGNAVLEDILESIRSLLRVWIRRATREAGQTEITVAEHAAVLEAIRSGSKRRAGSAMSKHMAAASARLHQTLPPD